MSFTKFMFNIRNFGFLPTLLRADRAPCCYSSNFCFSELAADRTVKKELKPSEKCSRNFLIFSDDKTAKNYFNIAKKKPPLRLICPITRQKARYFDPITRTPFATARAFRCLREALRQQLASKSEGGTVVIEQKSTRSPGSSQVK